MAGPNLALDFDGVICDSCDECLVAAVNARARLRGRAELVRRPADLDAGLVERFRAARHLVRPAGEYETLLHCLETRSAAPTAAEFALLCRDRAARIAAFGPVFFAVRAEVRDADPDAWTSLHRFYREASDAWADLAAVHEVYLVTNKDLASVRHLNAAWNLGLADERLFTCERFTGKPAAVREVAARRGVRAAAVTFVDDHPGHLREVARTGARCLWAAWGYHRACEASAAGGDAWTAIHSLGDIAAAGRRPGGGTAAAEKGRPA